MRTHWTFTDLFLDLVGAVRSRPNTSSLAGNVDYYGSAFAAVAIGPGVCKRHDVGLAGLFPSEAVARRPLRRQVLHGCAQHQNLLPLNLPCSDRAGKKRPLLSNGRCGGGSWIPSLSALPAGMFARNSGVARNFEHSFESPAPDRREWLGRRRNGRPCGAPGSRFAASSETIYPPPGCAAKHGSADSPSALR